jgi:hypothetical protein
MTSPTATQNQKAVAINILIALVTCSIFAGETFGMLMPVNMSDLQNQQTIPELSPSIARRIEARARVQ